MPNQRGSGGFDPGAATSSRAFHACTESEFVMAGLVPAIPIRVATPCVMNRDARDKRGHDVERAVQTNWDMLYATSKSVPASIFIFLRMRRSPAISSSSRATRSARPAPDAVSPVSAAGSTGVAWGKATPASWP